MRGTVAWIGLSAVSLLSLAFACGGKVVVDKPNGNGGAGGGTPAASTGTSTISLVTTGTEASTGVSTDDTSTATGPQPVCDCALFCQVIVSCFMVGGCEEACNALPEEVRQCVCDHQGDCSNIENDCGGGGSGGGGFQSCTECVDFALSNDCSFELDQCGNSEGCLAIAQCHDSCGYSLDCLQFCDHAPGLSTWTNLVECAVCNQCSFDCQSEDAFINYCTVLP
jgi:hypothetical protein